jgi:hypothetical protein
VTRGRAIPFPTALLAEHLRSGADKEAVDLSDEEVRPLTNRFTLGNPFYALAIAVSFISPAAVLVIIALLAVYYAVAGVRSPITGD